MCKIMSTIFLEILKLIVNNGLIQQYVTSHDTRYFMFIFERFEIVALSKTTIKQAFD